LLGDIAADAAQTCPAAFIRRRFDSVAKQLDQLGVAFQFGRAFALDRRLGVLVFVFALQDFGVNEFIARRHKGMRRLLLAETIRDQPFLADAQGEPREIAVAGNEAKAVESLGIEQIHRIDNHRAVSGVFPDRITKLLNRLNGIIQQHGFPPVQIRGCPIAVNALDVGNAEFGNFRHQAFDNRRIRVIGIDQHR